MEISSMNETMKELHTGVLLVCVCVLFPVFSMWDPPKLEVVNNMMLLLSLSVLLHMSSIMMRQANRYN